MNDEDLLIRPQFRRSLVGGYLRRDVDVAFAQWRMLLYQLRADLARAEDEAAAARSALADARDELERLRLREHELTQAVVDAQRNAREIERAAEARAREVVAGAEEEAERIRRDARRRVGDATFEIDELLRLRETLAQSVRSIVRDVEQAVARVERGEASPPPEAVGPAAAHARDLPTSEAGLPAAVPGEQASRVEVDAGPFADFASLSSFERALGRIPRVQDVYIRRFADERALIEVTTSGPVALAAALEDVLPHSLEVSDAGAGALRVDVLVPLATGRW